MHKFKITMTGANRGEIFIDGQKIPGVKAIEFSASASPDAGSTLKLIFAAPEIVVEGVADITTIGDTERRFEIAEHTRRTSELLQDILRTLLRSQMR
jgi:hypothetical protein